MESPKTPDAPEQPKQIVSLDDKLKEIYESVDLRTTCCRQCTCCRVACPQMYYGEAMNIMDAIWKWPLPERKNLIKTSMRYFFSNSMVKPCILLTTMADGKPGCRVYNVRPLNCRMYGLWPEDSYNARVHRFSKATGFERHQLPLNRQCPLVRRVNPAPKLTDELIEALFERLKRLDACFGLFKRREVDKGISYRTIHDWVLFQHLGEDKLSELSRAYVGFKPEEAQEFMANFEKLLDAANADDQKSNG